jgi:hypothetical protein
VTTYLLTARTADAIRYTATAASTGAPQQISQDGTTLDISDTHGSADARGAVDLTRYGFELTARSAFHTVMATAGGAGSDRAALDITTSLVVEPRAPSADDAGPGQGAHSAP